MRGLQLILLCWLLLQPVDVSAQTQVNERVNGNSRTSGAAALPPGIESITPRVAPPRYVQPSQRGSRTARVQQQTPQPKQQQWAADAKSAHYFAILGAVSQPGVYQKPESGMQLGQLVQLAGGSQASATGSVRIIRNGRAGLQVLLPQQAAYGLLNGDVIVLESQRNSTLTGIRTSIPTGTYEQPLSSGRPAAPELVHVVCLGLEARPVLFPLNSQIATLGQLLTQLGQGPGPLPVTRLIHPQAGQGAATPAPETPLVNGLVVILEPQLVRRETLPDLPPVIGAIVATQVAEQSQFGVQEVRAGGATSLAAARDPKSRPKPKVWNKSSLDTPSAAAPRIPAVSPVTPRRTTPSGVQPRTPAASAPAMTATEPEDPFSFAATREPTPRATAARTLPAQSPQPRTQIAEAAPEELTEPQDTPFYQAAPETVQITPGPSSRTVPRTSPRMAEIISDPAAPQELPPLPEVPHAADEPWPFPAQAKTLPPPDLHAESPDREDWSAAPRASTTPELKSGGPNRPAELPPFPAAKQVTQAGSQTLQTMAESPAFAGENTGSDRGFQVGILVASVAVFGGIWVGLWMLSWWGSPELLLAMLPPRKNRLQALLDNQLEIVEEPVPPIEHTEFHGRPQPLAWIRQDFPAESPVPVPHLLRRRAGKKPPAPADRETETSSRTQATNELRRTIPDEELALRAVFRAEREPVGQVVEPTSPIPPAAEAESQLVQESQVTESVAPASPAVRRDAPTLSAPKPHFIQLRERVAEMRREAQQSAASPRQSADSGATPEGDVLDRVLARRGPWPGVQR